MRSLKCVIPARGGSKGLPGKNIKEINNIPLLAYPILAAQKSSYISQIYVSTDSRPIKEIAQKYGALVIDRPTHLAQDDSLDIDVMRHAVEYLDDMGDIVHLRATTPMVDVRVLDKAIEYFLESDCTSLRSAHAHPETAYKSFRKDGLYWGGLFNEEYSGEYYNLPRQQLPVTYQPNGYIDILKPSFFMNKESLHGNQMLAYITPFAYDVDTPEDFKILESLYDRD